ncbi:DUF2182 domain-containing protein [Gymnodinialimonas ceratoperidinii]|uniref:DUF2182 domain-containing protein n=1 Tax=Gymnodinialimonas ceratoperidinii TaxID=2856823 RepID=A0A8F6TTZ2_9RHOB|nr:DUF2182 domain-containing protein [Gymnodinialimonas ceratoperidinii]QXT38428.1 DUF2182 domain-containing protein [Gymnodinialimonas ceratoperidinii]
MTHAFKSALWLTFFSIILISWVVLYQMSTGMGLDLIGRPTMDMGAMDMGTSEMGAMEMQAAPMGGMPASDMAASDMPAMELPAADMPAMDMSAMTRFNPLFGMWTLMMAAMMLPTLVPTLTNYDRLITSADGTRAGWLGVLAGYSIVWIAMAALFALTQIALLRAGVIDMMGVASNTWIAGGLLILVGGFQFTRAKEVCHGVCHAPMTYFLGHWRTGFSGGLRMGLGLGTFCAGCCWGFMALGFVGGMMSLLWMGLATLFMVFEKLPQIGHYVTKPLGAALMIGGLGVLAYPYIAA